MLLINETVMPIVTENGLRLLTGSGNVIAFSVDLSDFCRGFVVENNTTIKIFIGYDVLLINEVHNVIKRNGALKFWPQFDIRSSSGRKME